MDLSFTKQDRAFHEDVKDFFAHAIPKELREKLDHGTTLLKSDYVTWQKILFDKGWIAPNWPTEVGGCGWNATQQYIFNLELGLSGAPKPIPFGLNMVGPVIYTFGTEDQKSRHLPSILNSDIWWAQGYSEPGAGSDLASLRMTAVRDGDTYILNGTKLWTTMPTGPTGFSVWPAHPRKTNRKRVFPSFWWICARRAFRSIRSSPLMASIMSIKSPLKMCASPSRTA
nr:acyl-CoA dehydrogenase family protein [Iodidimonas gelatinilytica]